MPLPADRPEVVVIGAGIVGRAVAWQLAQRGINVLVLEQRERDSVVEHSCGVSCHLGYCHRDVAYSRLAMHAFTWWRVAERMSDAQLMTSCGELDIGFPGSRSFDQRLKNARNLGLDHELLSPQLVSRRFPSFHLPNGSLGIYHPGAVRIDGGRAMHALLQLAEDSGAHLLSGARVVDFAVDAAECRVRVAQGSEHSSDDLSELRCDRIIVCAGPWTADLIGAWPPLQVLRHTSHSFALSGDPAQVASSLPMFLIHPSTGSTEWFRGDFCADGMEIRVGVSQDGTPVERIDSGELGAAVDVQEMGNRVREFLPGLGSVGATDVSHFSAVTPDGQPCLDWLDPREKVFLCAGVSSDGSLAPVVGAAVADLLDGGSSDYEIEVANLKRFTRPGGDSAVT